MSCQHPNCSHLIHSICTNHCRWSLCLEHINEHRESLVNEFEQVLEDLIKPTNELSKSIEQTKQSINKDQQKELDHLKQSHENQIKKLEQQLIEINQFQNEYNQISEHSIKIKTNENLLTQNDFQQIDNLLQKINQQKNSLTDINFKQIDNLSQEINQHKNSLTDINLQEKQTVPILCPLTSFNMYGLSPSHNVRLCTSLNRTRNLFDHFRNYHHLSIDYANELFNAIKNNLDPIQTKIFPSNVKVNDLDDKQPCPLHNTSSESGIRCTPCTNTVTEKFLPIHLKTVHRLRLPQIKEIIKTKKYEE